MRHGHMIYHVDAIVDDILIKYVFFSDDVLKEYLKQATLNCQSKGIKFKYKITEDKEGYNLAR